MFALPARIGGMDIINPIKMCAFEFSASNKLTKPLQSLLLSQSGVFTGDIRGEQISNKKELYHMKFSATSSKKVSLLEEASPSLKRSIELASEKGASNWLTVLLLQKHNFSLHKTAFHDAVAVRYGWDPARLPQHYFCGTKFSFEHSFTCPKGAWLSIDLPQQNSLFDTELVYPQKSTMKLRWSPIYNQSLVSNLFRPLQTPKMEHVLTFQQMVFGWSV